MSDMAPISPDMVPEGYERRTVDVDGHPMTFTFYKGFASKVTHRTAAGRTIEVYEQDGTFHVPGGGAPADRCKMWIKGGPDDVDVELEIDDSPRPAPDYRGPIDGFSVVTRRNGGGAGGGRVRAVKGGNKVGRITVRGAGQGGGVHPHMPDDGGDTSVTNRAITCPPTC